MNHKSTNHIFSDSLPISNLNCTSISWIQIKPYVTWTTSLLVTSSKLCKNTNLTQSQFPFKYWLKKLSLTFTMYMQTFASGKYQIPLHLRRDGAKTFVLFKIKSTHIFCHTLFLLTIDLQSLYFECRISCTDHLEVVYQNGLYILKHKTYSSG